MDHGTIKTVLENRVLSIEFAHPKGNSMPGALLSSLASEITAASKNTAVGSILLRSGGSSVFCSGASFDELLKVSNQQESEIFFGGFAKVISAIRNSPKAIIGRVQGKAIGGGVGLIAACDYVVGLSTSAVRLSELSLGFGPFIIGPVVERKIGLAHFQNMTLDTEWRDSKWCLNTGLFSQVVETPSELDALSSEIALNLANSNPAAISQLKEIFWSALPNLEALLQDRTKTTAALVLTEFVKTKVQSIQNNSQVKK